jgi:hypothetical protein
MNGASGLLYKCTATDTWTLYYTPYTYPHPLVTPTSEVFNGRPIFMFLFYLFTIVVYLARAIGKVPALMQKERDLVHVEVFN